MQIDAAEDDLEVNMSEKDPFDRYTDQIAPIRRLLLAAFTPATLRRFCQGRPWFQPVVAEFGPGHGLDDMVDKVIDYCQCQILFDELLAEIEHVNPNQYRVFESVLNSQEPAQRVMRGQPKPKLDIGMVSGYSEYEGGPLLSTVEIPLDRVPLEGKDRARVWLVVRNEGTLSAKSVRILIENLSWRTFPVRLRFHDFQEQEAFRYSLPGNLEDRHVVIDAGDDQKFWGMLVASSEPPLPLPWHLQLRCRIWADGLGCSVDKTLTVIVKKTEEEKTQAQEIEQPNSRMVGR